MSQTEYFDRIIIGAGLYGLYAALHCVRKGQHVLVLERDSAAFQRATYINQARVHQGYHYPRSLSTAGKSAGYFEKFNRDYSFCINREFEQIYAISELFSWTDGEQFKSFCKAAGIPCEELKAERFFKPGMCDGAFLTREYTYDAALLGKYFLEQLADYPDVRILYGQRITDICRDGDRYVVRCADTEDAGSPGVGEDHGQREFSTGYLLNASYASTNQITDMLGYEKFNIKYELCEIILCEANDRLKNYGFTVMDGPFFSIMPFGMTGLHSLTAVTFTPHDTSYEELPRFVCQDRSGGYCTPSMLGNCNLCPARPESAYPYMSTLARKYMREEFDFTYRSSLYSMKPILKDSEIDDSRPTVVRVFSEKPYYVSVLSGKINTVYDLDEVLDHDD